MAQYPKIESMGSIGSIILAILEVQAVTSTLDLTADPTKQIASSPGLHPGTLKGNLTPRTPHVPLLRALWSLSDGMWTAETGALQRLLSPILRASLRRFHVEVSKNQGAPI